MRSRLLLAALPLALCLAAGTVNLNAATNPDDEVSFRYRIGSVNVDPKLNPNQDNLSKLDNILSGNRAIRAIELRASSSPDGPYYINERYAHERAEKMIQFLSDRYPSLDASVWQVTEVPEDWDGVADYLRRSSEDYKNEAMQIVRANSPNRKELLQDLYAGEAWDDLYKYAFPWLRAVKLRIVYEEGSAVQAPPVIVRTDEKIVAEGSIPIYFERSSSNLRQDFSGNAGQIARIRQQVADGADSLSLVTYASPEGSEAVNMSISKRRSAAVRDYLSRQTGIPAANISVHEIGEDWEGFAKSVNATYVGVDRENVLNILRNRTLGASAKEEALKKLDGGRTWQSLIQGQMTELRRVEVQCLKAAPKQEPVAIVEEPVKEEVQEVIQEEVPEEVEEEVQEAVVEEVEEVIPKEEQEEVTVVPVIPEVTEIEVVVPEEKLEVEQEDIQIEATDIKVEHMEVPENQPEEVEVEPEEVEIEPAEVEIEPAEPEEAIIEPEEPVTPTEAEVLPVTPAIELKPIIAISTNLLYDAFTAFNLGIEIPVAKHWSVMADAVYNNISFSGGRKIDLLLGDVGVNYYFGEDCPALSGWFASAGVGGGRYDIVGKEKGRQGTIIYMTAGGGYSFQLGSKLSPWRLKLAGGIGPLHTSFKYSERNINGEMIYKNDRNFTWQLPTNLQVSIIYLFQTPGKKQESR